MCCLTPFVKAILSVLSICRTLIFTNILPAHRMFLKFAFQGMAYKYLTGPFGLLLAPQIFNNVEVDEKLKKRKERFGILTAAAVVGAEDSEVKKRKRADRFGNN
ncbi:unnamed protein product [Oncorhynchus mykiss]|uniref:Uncharacterized protein n=1 Tax=Oncorhynchus mykiss TaxID=8022 RepID=A0A060WER6_ONCMY|nr:unnamed protein product [Oncorhynchus mykiss]